MQSFQVDFGVRSAFLRRVGGWLEFGGIAVFLLIFWLPLGLGLGGDAYYFGEYVRELEVIFPWGGFGLVVAFFGKVLNGTQRVLTRAQVGFFLAFLALMAVGALFSLHPQDSLPFVLLWAVAFLAAGFGDGFGLEQRYLRVLFPLGLALGVAAQKFFPELGVSSNILAMAALMMAVFFRMGDEFFGRRVMILLLFWVIFESQNLGLVILTLITWISSYFWLPRSKRTEHERALFSPVLFLLALSLWGFSVGHFRAEDFVLWIPYVGNSLVGVGEGQFLIGLQEYSQALLTPDDIRFPDWGMILTFLEQGLLGLGLVFMFVMSPVFFGPREDVLRAFLFFFFWFLTPELFSTGNGILFGGAFLLAGGHRLVFSERVAKPPRYEDALSVFRK